jgi:hypothetical protein
MPGKNRNRNRRRNQKKKAKAAQKAKAPEQTFECGICLEDCPLRHKMPACSLGCSPCAGEICTYCFCEDLKHRGAAYYVSGGGVSKWDDLHELTDHLLDMYGQDVGDNIHEIPEEEKTEAFMVYLKNHMFKGKLCPFCRSTCLWHIDETPRISPTTGKLTFHAPRHVIAQAFPTNPVVEEEPDVQEFEEEHTEYMDKLLAQDDQSICPNCFSNAERKPLCRNMVVHQKEDGETVCVCCWVGDKDELSPEELAAKVQAIQNEGMPVFMTYMME